jgi:hypothetical protein
MGLPLAWLLGRHFNSVQPPGILYACLAVTIIQADPIVLHFREKT